MVLVMENDWLIFEEDVAIVASFSEDAGAVSERPTLESARSADMQFPEILHDIAQIFNAAARAHEGDVVWLSGCFDDKKRKTQLKHGATAIGIAVKVARQLRDELMRGEVGHVDLKILEILKGTALFHASCCYPSVGSYSEHVSVNAEKDATASWNIDRRPTDFQKDYVASGTRGRSTKERWLISIVAKGNPQWILALKFPLKQRQWMTFEEDLGSTSKAGMPTASWFRGLEMGGAVRNPEATTTAHRERATRRAKLLYKYRSLTNDHIEAFGRLYTHIHGNEPSSTYRMILSVATRFRHFSMLS
jgi:hypothetical protein